MTETKIGTNIHPTEVELSDFLNHSISGKEKEVVEAHIATCRLLHLHSEPGFFAGKCLSRQQDENNHETEAQQTDTE